jgi:KDO2-lipid IV(A) lauroyltransferase
MIQPTVRRASNEQGLAKALEMVRIRTPSWKDLAVGGEARRKWLAYWFWDMPLDVLQWLLFHVFSILPIAFISDLGGLFARIIAPRFFPDAIDRSLANLRWLEPTWSDARVREVTARHFESIGRLRAEFCILHRLMRSGRISVENAELAKERCCWVGNPRRYLYGNWEILAR